MTLFSSEVMIIASCDDFFRPDSAKAIRDVVDALVASPEVSQITWMDNAPPLNIFGLPSLHFRIIELHKRRSIMRSTRDEESDGRWSTVSRDAKSVLLLLQIDWFNVRSDADCTSKLLDIANATLAQHPGVSMTLD